MTTTVTIHAHCASTKQVHITVTGQPVQVIQDGEKVEVYAYDERVISIKEELKPVAV